MPWPTIHFLRALNSGWEDPEEEAAVRAERWKELPLFDALAHPAIRATHGFEGNRDSDRFTIYKTATAKAKYPVWEARDIGSGPGWRTAVISHLSIWWSVMADRHDRFHSTATSLFSRQQSREAMEPTDKDVKLRALKLADAQYALDHIEWRKTIAMTVLHGFKGAWLSGGTAVACDIPPMPGEGDENVGYLIFEVVRNDNQDITADDSIVTVAVTINPPANFFKVSDGTHCERSLAFWSRTRPDGTRSSR